MVNFYGQEVIYLCIIDIFDNFYNQQSIIVILLALTGLNEREITLNYKDIQGEYCCNEMMIEKLFPLNTEME